MRRQILLTIILFTTVLPGSYSQSRLIFTSSYEGKYHKPDSILIEDINTGSRIMKIYPDTVLKLLITGDAGLTDDKPLSVSNYPNPFESYTNIEINIKESSPVNLTLSDGAGRIIVRSERELTAGKHLFTFTGGRRQLYIVTLQTRTAHTACKMICCGRTGNTKPELAYSGNIHVARNGITTGSHFNFNTGDNLRFTGFMTDSAGSVVRDTILDSPSQSKTYIFNFLRKKRIVILMYHKLTDSIPSDEYQRNTTDFENDLRYLVSKDYQILSMEDLTLLGSGEKKLTSDGIVITFDDGYESNYTLAAPALTRYNMRATFFLTTEWMGTADYLTWSQVWLLSRMQDDDGNFPFVIGSHTSSHPYLEQSISNFPTHDAYLNFLNTELGDSKIWITDITGQSDIYLSLPYGDGANNQEIISVAKANGYSGIRTSMWDSFDPEKMNIYALPSIPILSDSPIEMIEDYLRY